MLKTHQRRFKQLKKKHIFVTTAHPTDNPNTDRISLSHLWNVASDAPETCGKPQLVPNTGHQTTHLCRSSMGCTKKQNHFIELEHFDLWKHVISQLVKGSFSPCQSCGQTKWGHDFWTAPCSRRWHCSGQGGTEPPTCRFWPAHPGTHAGPGMGASWVGRRTQPALKALILALECCSNQMQRTGFLDPGWQVVVGIPNK